MRLAVSCDEVAREAGTDVEIVGELAPISLPEPIANDEIRLEELLSDDAQADPAFVVADG